MPKKLRLSHKNYVKFFSVLTSSHFSVLTPSPPRISHKDRAREKLSKNHLNIASSNIPKSLWNDPLQEDASPSNRIYTPLHSRSGDFFNPSLSKENAAGKKTFPSLPTIIISKKILKLDSFRKSSLLVMTQFDPSPLRQKVMCTPPS